MPENDTPATDESTPTDALPDTEGAPAEAETASRLPVSRRRLLQGVGVAGLVGVGTELASADPQGQVGTSTDPLNALYTQELNGGVTGDVSLTELPGSGLAVGDGSLTADLAQVGSGTGVLAGVTDDGIEYRSLTGSGTVSVREDDGTITIFGADLDSDTHTLVSDSDGEPNDIMANDIEFGSDLSLTDNGGGNVTVDGTDTHTTVSESDGDTSGEAQDIRFGVNLDLLPRDATGHFTVHASDTHTNVSDGGTQVVANTEDINFSDGLTVTDDEDGSVTVASEWSDTDENGLLEPVDGQVTGIEDVSTVQSSGDLHFNTDDGNEALTLRSPGADFGGVTGSGSIVGGSSINTVPEGVVGATIGGGGRDENPNSAFDDYCTVSGGAGNQAGSNIEIFSHEGEEVFATVGGGEGNTASSFNATVPGGRDNTANGEYSFAAGRLADTNGNDGAFVWGDSSEATVSATAANQVMFQANGGFVIPTGLTTGEGIDVQIDDQTGELYQTNSSARYKTNIQPLSTDTEAVLDLEPRSFEFEETGQPGVGLIAEEVDDVLPDLVNYDEKGRPNSVKYDRLGVYLVPEVRENRDRLTEVERAVEEREARIDELEADLAARDDRIAELESRLAAVESHLGLGGGAEGDSDTDTDTDERDP